MRVLVVLALAALVLAAQAGDVTSAGPDAEAHDEFSGNMAEPESQAGPGSADIKEAEEESAGKPEADEANGAGSEVANGETPLQTAERDAEANHSEYDADDNSTPRDDITGVTTSEEPFTILDSSTGAGAEDTNGAGEEEGPVQTAEERTESMPVSNVFPDFIPATGAEAVVPSPNGVQEAAKERGLEELEAGQDPAVVLADSPAAAAEARAVDAANTVGAGVSGGDGAVEEDEAADNAGSVKSKINKYQSMIDAQGGGPELDESPTRLARANLRGAPSAARAGYHVPPPTSMTNVARYNPSMLKARTTWRTPVMVHSMNDLNLNEIEPQHDQGLTGFTSAALFEDQPVAPLPSPPGDADLSEAVARGRAVSNGGLASFTSQANYDRVAAAEPADTDLSEEPAADSIQFSPLSYY